MCQLPTYNTFFSDEGQRPGEHVHEVGQPVGMGAAVELTNEKRELLIDQSKAVIVTCRMFITLFSYLSTAALLL